MTTHKVALITGGVAGMGLAVAEALLREGDWLVTLLDLNADIGESVASSLGEKVNFIKADVTSYDQQLKAFETTFQANNGRLDFVFANAGIAGRSDFYDRPDTWPPAPPSLLVEEICLRGVVHTSYLAMHFMRRNSIPGGVIIMTASASSMYATPELPMYAAAKHGVLGLMRSMSQKLKGENIRVNATLPGAIRTTLHSPEIWSQFPQEDFTSVDEVVGAVLGAIKDPEATGRALEISAGEVHDRKQPEFCNDTMRRIMSGKSY